MSDPAGTPASVSPKRGRRILITAAVLSSLVLVSVINHRRQQSAELVPSLPAIPSVSASPLQLRDGVPVPPMQLVRLGGRPVDLVASGYVLYALSQHPSQLYRLRPEVAHNFIDSTPVRSSAYKLVLDSVQAKLYLVQHGTPGHSIISWVDPLSLNEISRRTIPLEVRGGLANWDVLWLTTSDGLYVMKDLDSPPRRLIAGKVTATALDTANDRLVAAVQRRDSTDLVTFTLGTARPGQHVTVPLLGVSLALVFVDLWLAGTGRDGRGKVLHLDALTFEPRPAGSLPASAGPVTVWPGDTVLWAVTSARLTCIGRSSGSLLASADPASGPVVTELGVGYAMAEDGIRALDLSRTGCYRG
jgi:hypothetical protein